MVTRIYARGYDMPTYAFATADGILVEREYSLGKCPKSITAFGSKAYRCYAAEAVTGFVKGNKTPVKRGNATWPMEPCVASGVQPDQAQELRDFYHNRGLSIEVNNDGDPIYTSAKQRKKALKMRGMFDKASFN